MRTRIWIWLGLALALALLPLAASCLGEPYPASPARMKELTTGWVCLGAKFKDGGSWSKCGRPINGCQDPDRSRTGGATVTPCTRQEVAYCLSVRIAPNPSVEYCAATAEDCASFTKFLAEDPQAVPRADVVAACAMRK